jgi:hypothetical protein
MAKLSSRLKFAMAEKITTFSVFLKAISMKIKVFSKRFSTSGKNGL